MNDAYRKGLRAALKAIADLPTPPSDLPDSLKGSMVTHGDAISEGHEQAYRAIEAKLK